MFYVEALMFNVNFRFDCVLGFRNLRVRKTTKAFEVTISSSPVLAG